MEYRQSSKIKDWAVEDRPREKLLKKGMVSLCDAELIALLIRTGSPGRSAVELARAILKDTSHNLNEMGKLSVRDLQKYHGIGEAKAITIAAALELGRRRKLSAIPQRYQVTSSRHAFEFLYPNLEDKQHEEFWVLYLNRANQVIEGVKISQGGISGTVTDVKIILKHAVDRRACGMILCHNHPSGNTTPSNADIKITRKLTEAANYLDIQVLDHLITGENTFYSFADEGTL